MLQEQQKILFHTIYSSDVLNNFRNIIKADIFEHPAIHVLAKHLLSFYDKYHNIPTHMELLWYIQINATNGLAAHTLGLLPVMNEILDYSVSHNLDFTKDTLINILKEEAYRRFLEEAAISISKKEYANIIDSLIKLELSFIEEDEEEYCDMGTMEREERIQKYATTIVDGAKLPTFIPYDEADKVFKGGFRQGHIVILLAPTGFGKTTALISQGVMAIRNKFDVLHLSLYEDLLQEVVCNYESALSEEDVLNYKVSGEIIRKEYVDVDGNMLTNYPVILAHKNKIGNIVAYLRKVKQVKQTDKLVLIIDNPDSIEIEGKFEAERFRLKNIYEWLNALAKKEKIWIITTAQTNRKAEYKKTITTADISEDYNKCRIARYVIAICADDPTSPTPGGERMLFVAKNSFGERYHRFDVKFDFATRTIQPCNFSSKIGGMY